ncbi:MAG: hybrid sensor histidine kinase/response regulator [Chloroflexi bacterium]|nr:hybrid sensor histidine kinase/response regulator [Chloroflexota bacterium]
MFDLDDNLMRQLRETFKIEAAEHIQALNRLLLALEQNPSAQDQAKLIKEVFREAHSLKGAAGASDFGDVERVAHKLETVFGVAKAAKLALTRELFDLLYATVDAITVIVEATFQEQPHGIDLDALHARLEAAEHGNVTALERVDPELGLAPAPVAPTPPPAPTEPLRQVTAPAAAPAPQAPRVKMSTLDGGARDTIRVSTTKVDALMTQAGELLVAGLKIDQRLKQVEAMSAALEEINRKWLKIRAAKSNLAPSSDDGAVQTLLKLLEENQESLRTLSANMGDLKRGFSSDALHLARVASEVGEGVMKVRMLPVSSLFDAFPRLVRDLARGQGKEVELVLEGGETELDRQVLEEIKDPLIQLLRNAVDHGMETPEERVAASKPRTGAISVKAFQKGNNIIIQVADDGGGINCRQVKRAAVDRQLLSAEDAERLSEEETLRLIFASGLSTKAIVTGISGRGVGMDVVRQNVEALHGQVNVESTVGSGTTFTLTLPLTLATTHQLLVQVGDQTFGIPISAVERIERVLQKDVAMVSGRRAILVNGEPVSVVRLAQILEMKESEQHVDADGKLPVVLLGSVRKRIAFMVDDVIGQQETVVKSLGKQLARVRNIAGATILGSGQVIMTLNPSDLMKTARGAETRSGEVKTAASSKPKAKKERRVLVVDDSLSTRTLEKNILETAGYKVSLATDGREALNVLNANGNFDIIVSDVLMPGMDGLQLTQMVKKDVKLKKIPVVLVTSLDSRADKERGMEVGADAYLVKSNFDQSNLLQTIEQLI